MKPHPNEPLAAFGRKLYEQVRRENDEAESKRPTSTAVADVLADVGVTFLTDIITTALDSGSSVCGD